MGVVLLLLEKDINPGVSPGVGSDPSHHAPGDDGLLTPPTPPPLDGNVFHNLLRAV